MSLYKFKVANRSGKSFDTVIEADNQKDALKKLRGRNLVPLESYGETTQIKSSSKGLKFWSKSSFNVIEFTNRLVPLLRAQIQLERALGIIADGSDTPEQKEVVNSIRRGLHEGKKFSELIRSNSMHFPNIYANLVEAGEETGALKDVMIELQYFLNYRKETKDFMITSSIYPAIILLVTFLVVVLLFTVFVPRFSKIFLNMGRPLPLPTKIMFDVSHIATGLWWLWLLIIAALTYFISRIKKGGKARTWFDTKILKLPVLGEIIYVMEAGTFIKTLAVLLNNNVHLIKTVTIATKVIENRVIKKSLDSVNSDLKGGKKLSAALSKSKFMPKVAIQMLEVGEESGNMGDMLKQVADQLEKDMKVKINRLLALFEPVVILILAFVVLAVVLSIFMAIMEMNNV
ncbi:MAG: type II secretion system F family protein [bacterium]|nr:type II secretion system F family protein [bacterium]